MHSILIQLSKKRRKFCQCAVRSFTALLMSSSLIYCYTCKFAKKDHKISKYKGHQFWPQSNCMLKKSGAFSKVHSQRPWSSIIFQDIEGRHRGVKQTLKSLRKGKNTLRVTIKWVLKSEDLVTIIWLSSIFWGNIYDGYYVLINPQPQKLWITGHKKNSFLIKI